MALYDRIGAGYDRTRRADPDLVARLAAWLRPRAGRRYLDLACGTGSYTCALAAHGGEWCGVDLSSRMLRAARRRDPALAWRRARAEALPFRDGVFDGVLCTLAVHHFADREAAFREVRRVLHRGAFVLFTAEVGRTRRFWLRAYFPRMFERIEAREPAEAELLGALRNAGFARIEARPWWVPERLADHFLYAGKRRPELYFDPAVRAGISSFATLADPDEVRAGLARLRADLASGRFAEVAAAHPTPDGDYLLVRCLIDARGVADSDDKSPES